MRLAAHVIVSLILVLALFPFFGFYSLLALVGGVLIDFDHVIYYWIKFKSFDFKKGHKYFRDLALTKDKSVTNELFMLFHSVEFIILIGILSFYYSPFLVLIIGTIVHMIMDFIYESSIFGKVIKPFSLLVFYFKNAKKRK
ncbi:MAG: hypothetical protein U9O94_10540 [Nanoarchaeota archaeon]|nr:hypothetical protein [Nanoarchaeota archaeon]